MDSGEQLGFWVERNASAVAEVAGSEPVWVCWKPSEAGTGGDKKVAAVVLADSGWALHGEVWAEQARQLERHAIDPGRGGVPVDDHRKMRLWSPVLSWPLILRGSSLLCIVLALASAAALITDFGVRWRWGLGVIGTVALLGALATYVVPSTKDEKDGRGSSVSTTTV
ncbi:hypothetical protein HCC61_28615 [Streptomyces sp. HNM0575]|uniref:hypothetical protein n=1 Tax=Streptomyces sp. HNM0575 TaxID=2716338 RepID=UPI00145D6C9D|nr:hypothetical protein [Streptomyces sp. HNM0575]NLU76540.1 hypothetical protein [Streptomyces sp. HNM0575]